MTTPPTTTTTASSINPHDDDLLAILPPRYQQGMPVSNAPMGSADLILDADGLVVWDQIWGDFCDLALAGGPPHRETMLEPASPDEIAADPEGYAVVVAEIVRGIRSITNWEIMASRFPGWIDLHCPDARAATWIERAILAENIHVRRYGALLALPAGPSYRLDKEIKNVICGVAKTHHYWTEHITASTSSHTT